MKTTKKHFDLFVKECKKRVDDFGLHGWDIVYFHSDLDGSLAQCRTKIPEAQAAIYLNTEWKGYKTVTNQDIILTANHEIGHLLTARMMGVGSSRWADDSEMYEASEQVSNALVHFMRKHGIINIK